MFCQSIDLHSLVYWLIGIIGLIVLIDLIGYHGDGGDDDDDDDAVHDNDDDEGVDFLCNAMCCSTQMY